MHTSKERVLLYREAGGNKKKSDRRRNIQLYGSILLVSVTKITERLEGFHGHSHTNFEINRSILAKSMKENRDRLSTRYRSSLKQLLRPNKKAEGVDMHCA